MSSPLRRPPLDDRHQAAGAQLAEFGGWEMPLAYPAGTLAEHRACRGDIAVFDVSHLGTVRVEGPDAFETLQRTLTNDLDKISPGRAQYTHLLDDDGSVVDDIIVWWHPEGGDAPVFDVMPNASNTDNVLGALGGRETTGERAVLAVQGPRAREIAGEVLAGARDVGRFRVASVAFNGAECTVAGTGYTGEPGIEIAAPLAVAGALWDALVAAGAQPAGLGARDTLRLEAGFPLHGHELGPGITPLQAGLGWVLGWDKPVFRGRDALLAERERGVDRHLVGITTAGRRPARAGASVLRDGEPIGKVTSGNFSPTLGHGIALAFVPPDVVAGVEVDLDVRGRPLAGRVVDTPFIR